MDRTEHFLIKGRVQGVGFREFVRVNAHKLKLSGWVKNLPNGDVECLASGGSEEMENLFLLLQKGPTFSKVSGVDRKVSHQSTSGGFEIIF